MVMRAVGLCQWARFPSIRYPKATDTLSMASARWFWILSLSSITTPDNRLTSVRMSFWLLNGFNGLYDGGLGEAGLEDFLGKLYLKILGAGGFFFGFFAEWGYSEEKSWEAKYDRMAIMPWWILGTLTERRREVFYTTKNIWPPINWII